METSMNSSSRQPRRQAGRIDWARQKGYVYGMEFPSGAPKSSAYAPVRGHKSSAVHDEPVSHRLPLEEPPAEGTGRKQPRNRGTDATADGPSRKHGFGGKAAAARQTPSAADVAAEAARQATLAAGASEATAAAAAAAAKAAVEKEQEEERKRRELANAKPPEFVKKGAPALLEVKDKEEGGDAVSWAGLWKESLAVMQTHDEAEAHGKHGKHGSQGTGSSPIRDRSHGDADGRSKGGKGRGAGGGKRGLGSQGPRQQHREGREGRDRLGFGQERVVSKALGKGKHPAEQYEALREKVARKVASQQILHQPAPSPEDERDGLHWKFESQSARDAPRVDRRIDKTSKAYASARAERHHPSHGSYGSDSDSHSLGSGSGPGSVPDHGAGYRYGIPGEDYDDGGDGWRVSEGESEGEDGVSPSGKSLQSLQSVKSVKDERLLKALKEVPRSRREHLLSMLEGLEESLLGDSLDFDDYDPHTNSHIKSTSTAAAAASVAAAHQHQPQQPYAVHHAQQHHHHQYPGHPEPVGGAKAHVDPMLERQLRVAQHRQAQAAAAAAAASHAASAAAHVARQHYSKVYDLDAPSRKPGAVGAGSAGAAVPGRRAKKKTPSAGAAMAGPAAKRGGGSKVPAATRRLLEKLADALGKRPELLNAAEATKSSGKRLLLSPERFTQKILVDLGTRLSPRDTSLLASIVDPHGSFNGHLDYWAVLASHVIPTLKRKTRDVNSTVEPGQTSPRTSPRPGMAPEGPAGAPGAGAGARGGRSVSPRVKVDKASAKPAGKAPAKASVKTGLTAEEHRWSPRRDPPRESPRESEGHRRAPGVGHNAKARAPETNSSLGSGSSHGTGGSGVSGGATGAGGAGGLGRKEAVLERVRDIAARMDPRTAPKALQVSPHIHPTAKHTVRDRSTERPPMGLYDFQEELDSTLHLPLTLNEVHALVRCFSGRTDRLIDWGEFVEWFWSLARQSHATQRKKENQARAFRALSREATASRGAGVSAGLDGTSPRSSPREHDSDASAPPPFPTVTVAAAEAAAAATVESSAPTDAVAAGQLAGQAGGRWVIGQTVQARFEGGTEWYDGKIRAVNGNGTFAVRYDDGDDESEVGDDLIRTPIPPDSEGDAMSSNAMSSNYSQDPLEDPTPEPEEPEEASAQEPVQDPVAEPAQRTLSLSNNQYEDQLEQAHRNTQPPPLSPRQAPGEEVSGPDSRTEDETPAQIQIQTQAETGQEEEKEEEEEDDEDYEEEYDDDDVEEEEEEELGIDVEDQGEAPASPEASPPIQQRPPSPPMPEPEPEPEPQSQLEPVPTGLRHQPRHHHQAANDDDDDDYDDDDHEDFEEEDLEEDMEEDFQPEKPQEEDVEAAIAQEMAFLSSIPGRSSEGNEPHGSARPASPPSFDSPAKPASPPEPSFSFSQKPTSPPEDYLSSKPASPPDFDFAPSSQPASPPEPSFSRKPASPPAPSFAKPASPPEPSFSFSQKLASPPEDYLSSKPASPPDFDFAPSSTSSKPVSPPEPTFSSSSSARKPASPPASPPGSPPDDIPLSHPVPTRDDDNRSFHEAHTVAPKPSFARHQPHTVAPKPTFANHQAQQSQPGYEDDFSDDDVQWRGGDSDLSEEEMEEMPARFDDTPSPLDKPFGGPSQNSQPAGGPSSLDDESYSDDEFD